MNKQTNNQTKERTNEQTNERTNKRTNKQTNERTNKRTNKQTKNTTISISPLVVSRTLSAVQSFDVERKGRHQTTTTPSETREGGAI